MFSFTSRHLTTSLLCAAALGATACSLELTEKKDKPSDDQAVPTYPQDPNGSWSSSTPVSTDAAYGDETTVRVFVQYALTEKLGDNLTLYVEAFGNDQFQGTPAAVTSEGAFDAQPGEWKEVRLDLRPGTYFLRAFLTNEQDTRVPYPLSGMQPVDAAPMGIYGAASSQRSLEVGLYGEADPAVITIDRLYKRPGSEPDTNAKLRIEMKVADGAQAEAQKRVRVELRSGAELDEMPKFTFEMRSDDLRVEGRVGTAEFVTPSLPEGDYVLFVFVDADGNGYYDAGELAAMSYENGQPKAVDVRKDHTRTVALELTATPALP